MDEVLRTENLSKHFGPVRAVEGLSLNVHRGEIYGFLGLNGAGKTTTIRMLLGMIRPSAGAAFLFGRRVDPGLIDLWRKVGYLVEIPYSYPDLTVRENLEIARRLRLINGQGSVDEVIEIMKLGSYRNRKARSLSSGNAQRLGLAKALLHRPEILILDEPANGLDPAGIVEIRELLREMAVDRGVTIFISSHILAEIARLATRIGIIHAGRLIQELDTDELEHERNRRLLVRAVDPHSALRTLTRAGYVVNRSEDGILELPGSTAFQHPENVATLLVRGGFPPTMLRVDVEDLESYFLRTISSKGGLS
ncbi:MAG: ABC transporter ATP-binding protein [Spirochaetaceae bacterium]|nr:MAG: ABC transporter ATP-binding protein [Spirochaetaceae bacterium]